MSKRLSVGDVVVCRLFNSIDQKFYGKEWTAEVVGIDHGRASEYSVTCPGYHNIDVWRKEIKRIVRKVGE